MNRPVYLDLKVYLKLCYTDTDSVIVSLQSEGIYVYTTKDDETRF